MSKVKMSLKVQLEHLEEKISILTARLNQGDEWKRHLEYWLFNHLGMNFPAHLSMSEGEKLPVAHAGHSSTENNENNNDTFKENEENQFSSLIKFRTKRSYSPDLKKSDVKIYQKKKRISTTNDKNSESQSGVVIKPSSSIGSRDIEMTATTTTTSFLITPTEIVQSPDNEIEIENVKYEAPEHEDSQEQQAETVEINAVNVNETIISDDPNGQGQCQEEARYRIQEENNVLHIIKIEADPLAVDVDGAHVINYGNTLPIVQLANVQHDNNTQLSSNLAVFSGSIGEETAIGFLNPDGSVTPCRPNVIISAGSGLSNSDTVHQYEVVAAPPPPKPVNDPIDPKGTFVCNICENTFQGLYLFRQHEKKSECRRIAKAKLAKLKKPETSASASSPIPGSSIKSPESPSYALPNTSNLSAPTANCPVLKFKCNICGSCYASEAYLKFHMSKIHNASRAPD